MRTVLVSIFLFVCHIFSSAYASEHALDKSASDLIRLAEVKKVYAVLISKDETLSRGRVLGTSWNDVREFCIKETITLYSETQIELFKELLGNERYSDLVVLQLQSFFRYKIEKYLNENIFWSLFISKPELRNFGMYWNHFSDENKAIYVKGFYEGAWFARTAAVEVFVSHAGHIDDLATASLMYQGMTDPKHQIQPLLTQMDIFYSLDDNAGLNFSYATLTASQQLSNLHGATMTKESFRQVVDPVFMGSVLMDLLPKGTTDVK